jgi:glycosyltransferase involved in cell wall biosynthesis
VSDRDRRIAILGTRGVPAAHGGFETFAGRLAPFLAERGWDVRVYCQGEGPAAGVTEDDWRGVRRVHVPTGAQGALGTIEFDVRSTLHSVRRHDLKLVLGYNTAVLNLVHRLGRRCVVMNMDGIEWRRAKWSPAARAWLRANEWIGAASSHRLVADHPEIERHLRSVRRGAAIDVIPYGADAYAPVSPDPLEALGLEAGGYFVVVARIEPENSLLEIVRAFTREPHGAKLVVLGTLTPDTDAYHAAVLAAAGEACVFPGAIYDPDVVARLRHGAIAYVHGHTVGGTNPSLVEALGAGAAVIAHDNPFNHWVAGDAALYFGDEEGCRAAMACLVHGDAERAALRAASARRHHEAFRWDDVLGAYDALLTDAWAQHVRRAS